MKKIFFTLVLLMGILSGMFTANAGANIPVEGAWKGTSSTGVVLLVSELNNGKYVMTGRDVGNNSWYASGSRVDSFSFVFEGHLTLPMGVKVPYKSNLSYQKGELVDEWQMMNPQNGEMIQGKEVYERLASPRPTTR